MFPIVAQDDQILTRSDTSYKSSMRSSRHFVPRQMTAFTSVSPRSSLFKSRNTLNHKTHSKSASVSMRHRPKVYATRNCHVIDFSLRTTRSSKRSRGGNGLPVREVGKSIVRDQEYNGTLHKVCREQPSEQTLQKLGQYS